MALRRMTVEEVEQGVEVREINEEDLSLVKDCYEVLGYRVAGQALDLATASKPLLGLLKECDIAPFNQWEVDKYKKSKAGDMHDRFAKYIQILAAIAFLLSSVVIYHFSRDWFLSLFPSGMLFVFGAFLVPIFLSGERVRYWQPYLISRYDKPIPEFVLSKAIQIKRAADASELPASLEIEELAERNREFNGDPFLRVSTGTEVYYVEVWDEPKFERSLWRND